MDLFISNLLYCFSESRHVSWVCCFSIQNLSLSVIGLWTEGNDVKFRSLRGLRHKLVKLKHHVEVYNWCLSENITPKGLHLKKKAYLGKVSKNSERKYFKRSGEKAVVMFEVRNVGNAGESLEGFSCEVKRINQEEGKKLVCDWPKILERFEKTWTDQLADRRKFKLWSVKGLSQKRRSLSPGAIRDLRTLVSSNELYNNGLRRNGEDSLNVNQVECMEVDRRKLVNKALE